MSLAKAIMCWSGGKDSAYCLHKVISERLFDVRYLLTTLNATYKRISMHGIREELLDLQAASIGIPLKKVWVSEGTNDEYERQMREILVHAKTEGIEHVIFGDIFLVDLRAYREKNLTQLAMTAVFPLWKTDTAVLMRDLIHKGFKTLLCCTNDAYLGEEWLGREINNEFLAQLPSHVDPCGENGEYHTFCCDGPLYSSPIPFSLGEHVYKPLEIKTTDDHPTSPTKGFWFCDIESEKPQHNKP